MSIPTLQGLQTALSGLMANQESLDVTGQNIANAQTPGYSRQTAVLQTGPPIAIPVQSPINGNGAQLGTGVGVETITRIHDAYLEGQYRGDSAAFGSANTTADTLEQVQTALQEPSGAGLSSRLSAFFNAWNGLADSPTSLGAREAVVGAGASVADALNGLSQQVSAASDEASAKLRALAGAGGEVQSDGEQIAALNGQIKLAEQAGQPPNELLDRREQIINSLATLANVSVAEGEFGTVNVTLGGTGEPLVEATTVHWPQELASSTGGQLGALIALSEPEGKLAQLQTSLNKIAESLAGSVNELQPRQPFFAFAEGSAAASIAVVATAGQLQTGPEGEPGANSLAVSIASLRGGETESLYSTFVARVGTEVKNAKATEATAEAMRTAVASQRQVVSGVSLDEEMTNMITFQRGYEASARTLTVMDQVLETLIEHTGTAGL
jgi:flagellar hook-associated protein 1 FlgK